MGKILKEILACLCALLVAAGIVFFVVQNLNQTTYDTFTGYVNKIPVDISSPTNGQILTLPFSEGTSVTKGQTLATIQIFTPHFTTPASDALYQVHGNILSVQSPVNGIVGKVAFAPQSTIEGNASILQIYTIDNTEIQLLLPQGKNLSSYTEFFASNLQNGVKYPLQILGQIPTDLVSDIPSTMVVYRAKCLHLADCQNLLNNEVITIYAQVSKQNHFL